MPRSDLDTGKLDYQSSDKVIITIELKRRKVEPGGLFGKAKGGQVMRTLIYKRTHTGDPDKNGRFGIHDCMRSVRTWGFEAVIGVGGSSAEPESHGLARKVNWIGIGPHKRPAAGKPGLIVTFDHFLLFESDGPSFPELAPKLANRMYSKNVRKVMNSLDRKELGEVGNILALAKDAPPSSAGGAGRVKISNKCVPLTPSAKAIKSCSS